MTHPTLRLGDILVMQGAVERSVVEQATATMCTRIGHALRLNGLVDGRALAHAIAKQKGLSTFDLMSNLIDTKLFVPRDMNHYHKHCYVPVQHRGNVLTLVTCEPSDELVAFAEKHYGLSIILRVTTAREIAHYLTARGAGSATRTARLGLRRRYRHLVADKILVAHQLRALAIIFLIIIAIIIAAPRGGWHALVVLCNAFYVATLLVKLSLYRQGSKAAKAQGTREQLLSEAAAALDEATLPIYSILVPMYKERKDVMARLIERLRLLDYPAELLDIKLIVEADDITTISALKSLHPPATMEIVVVAPSQPRTKPKACNVALQNVRGDYVVIYDAEDAPAPNQLKLAVAAFRTGAKNLACLQASLNYYNREENLLTRMFALEYSSLFRILLPALERMGLPIPLGGTSNHLRTDALRDAGGWDAFNVTEDADLGIRLAYLGYTTETLPSLTLEEAPITLGAWLKQRTRWIKGYIQTWLVYTRDTKELKRRLGRHGYYGFQFFIGAPALTFLLAPLFWAVFLLSLTGAVSVSLSPEMLAICAFSFIGGILSHWLFALKAIRLEGWSRMGAAFWLYPFYWLLHSLAAARALIQLVTAPHYWDKTAHGKTRIFPVDTARARG